MYENMKHKSMNPCEGTIKIVQFNVMSNFHKYFEKSINKSKKDHGNNATTTLPNTWSGNVCGKKSKRMPKEPQWRFQAIRKS